MARPESSSTLREVPPRAVWDLLPQLLWTMNAAGRLAYVNRGCREFSGLTGPELQECDFSQLIHPEEYERLRACWHDAFREQSGFEQELRLRHASGQFRWVRVHLYPLGEPEGETYLGTAVSIENERRTRRLQEITAALSGSLTPREVIDVVLQQAIEVSGAYAGYVALLQHRESLALAGHKGYPPHFLDAWQTFPLHSELPVTQAVHERRALYLTVEELQQFAHNATTLLRTTASVAALPLIAQGQVLGVVGLSFPRSCHLEHDDRDFVELLVNLCAQALHRAQLYEAEAALALENARLYQSVRASEARYRSLVDATAQIVWSTPPDGQLSADQVTWGAFTGQPAEEFSGEGWVAAVHPEDRARVQAAWASAVRDKRPYEVEKRVRRADGEYRFMLARAVPVFDEHGELCEWVGLHSDITDLKRAEAEVRELNSDLEARVEQRTRELESLNDELQTFTYSVSHDLQTPVRHVLGFAGLLQRSTQGQLGEKGERHLSAITEAAERMRCLIDDLLQLSRLGRQQMTWQSVDLAALTRQVCAELAPDAQDREVEWQIEALPTVTGDRALLRVVMTNLLGNALKYTRSRPRAHIRVWSEESAQETVVHVRDNGVGFDSQRTDRLFGAFQRLHSPQEFEGNGVGLANVRRAIHRHDGRTWAQGETGCGATFSFALPGNPPEG